MELISDPLGGAFSAEGAAQLMPSSGDRLDGLEDAGQVRRSGQVIGDRDAQVAPGPPGRTAHPAGAVVLERSDDAVGFRIAAEGDEDLVQDYVVADFVAGRRELLGERLRQQAATVDEVGNAVAAELLQPCPDGKTSGSARGFQHVVAGLRLARADQVRGAVAKSRSV